MGHDPIGLEIEDLQALQAGRTGDRDICLSYRAT
jgi:hypothetical protein